MRCEPDLRDNGERRWSERAQPPGKGEGTTRGRGCCVNVSNPWRGPASPSCRDRCSPCHARLPRRLQPHLLLLLLLLLNRLLHRPCPRHLHATPNEQQPREREQQKRPKLGLPRHGQRRHGLQTSDQLRPSRRRAPVRRRGLFPRRGRSERRLRGPSIRTSCWMSWRRKWWNLTGRLHRWLALEKIPAQRPLASPRLHRLPRNPLQPGRQPRSRRRPRGRT